MSFSKQTKDSIAHLARLLIENKGKVEQLNWPAPTRWGDIPDDIEYDKSEGESLRISGEEYIRYQKCLQSLESERSLEYMSRREIDRELWHLVCEIFIESDQIKDSKAIERKIVSFQKRLDRPTEKYEVLIPIENLEMGLHIHEIAGVKLFKMEPEYALSWGIKKGRPLHDILYDAVINRTVAVLTEEGNDPWKAVSRARDKLGTALNALRVSLVIDHKPRIVGWKIHDIEMLFKQSEHVGIRKQGDPSSVLSGWSRSFRKLELSVNDTLSKQLEESEKLISYLFNGQIKGRICGTLIRALEWIGDSITREEIDGKIVDLCTALESLLATKQDKRKGELIALRMTLLYTLLGKPFFDPVQLLEMYNKRSDIVHGSQRNICTDSDYTVGRWIATDVFQKVLVYIQKKNIAQHAAFIRSLQSDKILVQKAVDFWKPYPEYYKDIVEACDSML